MKAKRLNIEYLTKMGFMPFKEESDIISYNKTYGYSIYVALEHHNWNVESIECNADWWVLMISCKNPLIMVKCECNNIIHFEEILNTFGIK